MIRTYLSTSLAVLALFAAAPSAAQEAGSIVGHVSDKKSRHAIPFATVTVVEAKRGGLTDSEGQFRVLNVPAGTYEIRVQFLGYQPESQKGVVVAAGKPTTLSFELTEIVVQQEKAVEVSAERRLVEVRQGATIRSVNANEIRNLPVQTITEVLQKQAGINTENDQIHVRGGRADETVFVVNGVANRDLVTGQSTAGQLSARSVAEVNVATGAYDVRYGNALSGIVEVKLKEGSDQLAGGVTSSTGSYGARALQLVVGGPDHVFQPIARRLGLPMPGNVAWILDVSASLSDTRFYDLSGRPTGFFERLWKPGPKPRMRSGYEDGFFGRSFTYGTFFTPSQDNRWAARAGLSWKPNNRDKITYSFSKRLDIDQGFTRTFLSAQGDIVDPAYPWKWAHRIEHAPTFLDDNVQTSLQWRRTLSTTGYTELLASRYFNAERRDVLGKNWSQYVEPDDQALDDPVKREDFFQDTGDDNTWQDRRTNTWDMQWALVQRVKRHEVELGFDHQFQTAQYVTIQEPWIADPDGLGGAHDLWQAHPSIGALYLRDRIEYEGFTANVGLRMDYWFLGREAERAVADTNKHNIPADIRRDFYRDTQTFFGRRYKSVFSPRVIVAHPITENSSFFFNYGRFSQNPSYRYVYSKLGSISSEAFPLLGNPDLNPQVSINYEVGAKHQFMPTAALNLTFFVKDVYDYPEASVIKHEQGDTLVDIFVYFNGHFARAKGFEIELEKRRTKLWSGRLSYTFQQTKGKSSDPNDQRAIAETGGSADETRLSQTNVRWNRPHKLSASLDLRFDPEAPRGLGLLKHSGLNVYVEGQSGRPYTPLDPVTNQDGIPNSKNAPFQLTTDVRANHWVHLGGKRFDLGLSGTNVFNNKLIYRVDRITGRGRKWGEGQYSYDRLRGVNPRDLENLRVSDLDDPSNYGSTAQWRLTVDYDF
jgi:TonB-dependent receptor-like protein/carboxypeptidase family protein